MKKKKYTSPRVYVLDMECPTPIATSNAYIPKGNGNDWNSYDETEIPEKDSRGIIWGD